MGNPCIGLVNVVVVINTSIPHETEVHSSHLNLESCAAEFLNRGTWLSLLVVPGLTRLGIFFLAPLAGA